MPENRGVRGHRTVLDEALHGRYRPQVLVGDVRVMSSIADQDPVGQEVDGSTGRGQGWHGDVRRQMCRAAETPRQRQSLDQRGSARVDLVLISRRHRSRGDDVPATLDSAHLLEGINKLLKTLCLLRSVHVVERHDRPPDPVLPEHPQRERCPDEEQQR